MLDCWLCGQTKPESSFAKNGTTKRGFQYWCRPCAASCKKELRQRRQQEISDYNARYYAEHKEVQLAAKKKYTNTTPKGKFTQYRHGAKRRGHIFTLTFEQFSTFWQKPCYYCGDSIDTIGLDRIESTQGYNFENVVTCCETCNKMKRDYSTALFIPHIQKIAARHKDWDMKLGQS